MKKYGEVAKWMTVTLVVLLLVSICLDDRPVQIVVWLLAGWALYPVRVIPRVTVNAGGIITAAITLLIIGGLGHWLCRWLFGEMTGRRWQPRWTAAGLIGVVMMFAAGTAFVGIVHQTAWLARSEQPLFENRMRERSFRVRCASRMRQVGQAIQAYLTTQGKYPDSLDDLIRANLLDHAELLICPSSNDDKPQYETTEQWIQAIHKPGHCSYIYLGKGLPKDAPADTIILVEPLINHEDDGGNVLYADGHVDWHGAQSFVKLLRERLPASQPATLPAR